MPRKRRMSTTSLEDDDYLEEKYGNDEFEGRAPRNAANARERARMRVLSKAFCRLKTTLPWVPADTKLSKLDTLRLAATYIAHLRAVLRDDNDSQPDSTRSLSLSLSWPFSIQGSNPPVFLNNNCAVSSTSSTNSPNSNHYNRSQHQMHQEVQGYHPVGHHNMANHHEQMYY